MIFFKNRNVLPFKLIWMKVIFMQNIFKSLKNLSTSEFSEIKQLFQNNLFRKEKISVFETPERVRFNGIIKGVSDIGELLVETENNPLQKFQMKEVKLIY